MNKEYVIPHSEEVTSNPESWREKTKKVVARGAGIAVLAAGAGLVADKASDVYAEYTDLSFEISVDEAVGGTE